MRLTTHNLNKNGHFILKTIFLSLLFSALIFIPYMIYDNGYFLYYGDFNVQEVPFYQMVHDAVQSGNYKWSSTTDLGSGLIGSYSFYLLGSPFFWITMLFPSKAVPYLMGPLFMLKFVCAALAGYVYLKRYVKNKDFAVAGGLLYAFSGFSIYNIFFFHFHEAIIAFPLLLAALDAFMKDNRRGVLALTVFASCIVNYYFFAGQVIFVIIYWIVMVCTKNYKVKFTQILLLAFEVLLGFIATAILLLPSVLSVMGNPRLEKYPNGWDALAYSIPQRYWYIILSFFFPPELPAFPNFTKNVDCNWASVSGWLPLFSMAGVIAFLQTKSKSWLKKILPILFLMALVPLFNSAFQLFNSSIYYARWFYMLELMIALATIKAIENSETNWERAFGWTAGITVGIAVLIGLIPNYTYKEDDPSAIEKFSLGVEAYIDRYWIYVAAALVGILLCVLIMKKYKKQAKKLAIYIFIGIGVISTVTSSFIVCTGKTYGGNDKTFIIPYALNNGEDLTMTDLDVVRSDFYESLDNLGMYWQIPSMNAFHSVVSTSIMEFYDSIGITRDVASRLNCDYYALRGLFSCKYLFDEKDERHNFKTEEAGNEMPGWEYYGEENGCYVYENSYYIPMGFMFDTYLTEKDWETLYEYDRHLALLKALVLSDEQMKKYSDITNYDEYNGDKVIEGFRYSYEDYYTDCKKLQGKCCSQFSYDNDGFTAEIENTGDDNLLFFSIPYDKGWTAYVNGEQAEIEKVDKGFMAVRVPGNTKSSIKFVYNQPGFTIGIIITVICGIIYFIYLVTIVIFKRIKKKNKSKQLILSDDENKSSTNNHKFEED
ncbi:MAG: YfhO family protein [Oscillospiraceae bacterium]|nr:YfhO family protein [Oscillospiraceae bacterium]